MTDHYFTPTSTLVNIEIVVEKNQKIRGYYRSVYDVQAVVQKPVVLILHGLTSQAKNYELLCEDLANVGISNLAVSLRGHGESDGDFNSLNYYDGLKDVEAAFTWLLNNPDNKQSPIGICGMSTGADQAAYLASKYDVSSVLLRSPATFDDYSRKYDDVKKKESVYFQSLLDSLDDTSLVKNIQTYLGPLFVMQSDNDEVIPARMTEYIYDCCPSKSKRKHLFKDAQHSVQTLALKKEMRDLTCAWFLETLS